MHGLYHPPNADGVGNVIIADIDKRIMKRLMKSGRQMRRVRFYGLFPLWKKSEKGANIVTTLSEEQALLNVRTKNVHIKYNYFRSRCDAISPAHRDFRLFFRKLVMIVALNDKQKLFYKEYLVDSNATQAAIRAGYSKKTAYSQGQRLLKHVEGKKFLSELMAEKESQLIADQDEVLKYLTSVLRGEECEEVVVVEGRGDGMSVATTVTRDVCPKDKLKAAELLGKRYSLFNEKVKLDVTPVVIGGDDSLED